MRKRSVTPWIVGAIIAVSSPLLAQTDSSASAVSIDRISAALKQPASRLVLPAPSIDAPTFRLNVPGQPFVTQPSEDPPFDPTFGLPSAGELLMGGIGKIRSAVVEYKRGRAERRARDEVDDAVARFCAVHECPSTR